MKHATIIYLNDGSYHGVYAGSPEEYARSRDYTIDHVNPIQGYFCDSNNAIAGMYRIVPMID